MKPFNLQEFQKDPSHKIVTRRGFPVRIICTDAKNDMPIVALVSDKTGTEIPYNYYENGKYYHDSETSDDLFFASKQGEGWVNVYKIADTDELEASIIFSTKEDAEFYREDNPKYVATTKITWEE